MLKKKYKYVILGGGLSGLSTAYILSKKYKGEVLIIEKDDILGGLAKGIYKNGDILDNGSHRIQKNYIKEVLDFLSNDLNLEIYELERNSKIFLKNGFINYPIKSFKLLIKLNIFKSFLSILSSFFYKFKKSNSFEKKIISKVGKYIYNEFYKPYAEKVWGIKLTKLSVTVVKKRFSLNPINILKQIFLNKKNNFLYLKGGFAEISKVFEKKLLYNNVKIIKGLKNYKINFDKNYLEFDGKKISYNKLISTIPLYSLIKLGKINIEDNLSYRGLYLVYLYFNKEPLLEGETFYFPQKDFIFGRVSIPKRFNKKLQKGNNYTVYCCEIPYWDGKMDLKKIIKNTVVDLIKSGLITEEYILDNSKTFKIFEKNVYPLYSIGWEQKLNNILNQIYNKYDNIYISGRQGLFLHCNIDHSIKIGLDLGKYLLNNKSNLYWKKNIYKYNNYIVRD